MWYLIFVTEGRDNIHANSLPVGWCVLRGPMQSKVAEVRDAEEYVEVVKPWHRVTLVEIPAEDRRRLAKLVGEGLSPSQAFKELLRARGPRELILSRHKDSTPKARMIFGDLNGRDTM